MTSNVAYRLNHDQDSTSASDGISRYGAYLRLNAHKFAAAFEYANAADFAAVAFEVATAPIMTPAYAQEHRRIITTRLAPFSEHLIARVELVTGRPDALRAPAFRGESRWYGWPTSASAFGAHSYLPDSDDIAERSYLLTSTTAHFALTAAELPLPAGPDDEIELHAMRALEIVIDQLNDVLNPIIAALERDGMGAR
ncbi:hypothetical protein ACIBKY_51585 [Nonomuraea sp. NPDC050394]|uniref:hypothetical protein n=1 Tax=Nonomuraea sp. NPDC050394 TaxID=3364363 RepID=UPI00378ED56D